MTPTISSSTKRLLGGVLILGLVVSLFVSACGASVKQTDPNTGANAGGVPNAGGAESQPSGANVGGAESQPSGANAGGAESQPTK